MKTIILTLFTGILIIPILNAQCVIELDIDKTFCEMELDIGNTPLLEQDPIILNGIPPYEYKWTADYWAFGIFHFSASNYLSDTTIANPNLIQSASNNDWITMKLEITDSVGNSCQDSIRIRFSSYAWNPTNAYTTINQGDTVQFIGVQFVHGGIPPLQFNFIPTEGLSDPNDLNSLAFPDTSTVYSLFAIDSTGCVSDTFPIYYINVLTTGTNVLINSSSFKVFPNPVNELINIEFDKELNSKDYKIIIFELTGKEILSRSLLNEKTVINLKNIDQGIYIYSISNDQNIYHVGKIIKN